MAKWVREIGGQVSSAPTCYGSSQGSDIFQEYRMGDISNKSSGHHTLAAKKYTKKNNVMKATKKPMPNIAIQAAIKF